MLTLADKPASFVGIVMSVIGPRLPTWASQQHTSYLGYSRRDANIVWKTAHDTEPIWPMLFDHLVSAAEQRKWNAEAERLGRFHVDDEVEL